MSLTESELALARARTYGLLAELMLDGWTERARAVVSTMPWAPTLSDDVDLRAARRERVFGRGVPPYESVFCAPDGLLGGAVSSKVAAAYTASGFRHSRTDCEADHLGLELACLGFLCGAEADGLRDGVAVEGIRQHQQAFLQAHLGRWVASLALGVRNQGIAEWTSVLEVAAELVADHLQGEAGEVTGPDLDLDDAKTGLKSVAAFLLVPARCGMWLGAEDIRRISATAGVPCGFGRRIQMLESLLFGGVDHEALPAVLDALNSEAVRWRASRAVAVIERISSA